MHVLVSIDTEAAADPSETLSLSLVPSIHIYYKAAVTHTNHIKAHKTLSANNMSLSDEISGAHKSTRTAAKRTDSSRYEHHNLDCLLLRVCRTAANEPRSF